MPFIYRDDTIKALANNIAILEFAIQRPQHLMYLGWTFATKFFSAVYKIRSQKFILSTLNVGVFESQIWELQFYLQTPL